MAELAQVGSARHVSEWTWEQEEAEDKDSSVELVESSAEEEAADPELWTVRDEPASPVMRFVYDPTAPPLYGNRGYWIDAASLEVAAAAVQADVAEAAPRGLRAMPVGAADDAVEPAVAADETPAWSQLLEVPADEPDEPGSEPEPVSVKSEASDPEPEPRFSAADRWLNRPKEEEEIPVKACQTEPP